MTPPRDEISVCRDGIELAASVISSMTGRF